MKRISLRRIIQIFVLLYIATATIQLIIELFIEPTPSTDIIIFLAVVILLATLILWAANYSSRNSVGEYYLIKPLSQGELTAYELVNLTQTTSIAQACRIWSKELSKDSALMVLDKEGYLNLFKDSPKP